MTAYQRLIDAVDALIDEAAQAMTPEQFIAAAARSRQISNNARAKRAADELKKSGQ